MLPPRARVTVLVMGRAGSRFRRRVAHRAQILQHTPRCVVARMRTGIQPDSVGEAARFPLVRWVVGEVAAWAAGALGLGLEVAAVLRAADIDGEALASLTEHDMQALGIEPFGSRRRLTLRVADSLGAAIGGNASPAVATGPDGATKAAEPRPPASPPPPHLQQSPIGERR
jgi:hypothetical protein